MSAKGCIYWDESSRGYHSNSGRTPYVRGRWVGEKTVNGKRANELDTSVTELTLENAGELIDKAGGVTVKVRAVVQQKFTDLLNLQDVKVQRVGVQEAAYVERSDDGGSEQSGTQQGNQGNTQGGGNNDENLGDGD